jgi:small subunit ribosomal protein S11
MAEAAKKVSKKKKLKKKVRRGQAHVLASYNNTIVTLTDQTGNVLAWSSAGHVGFKGPKKSTPYAASQIVKDVIDKVKEVGLEEVEVFVKGVGSGREGAIRALHANGLNVLSIKDMTPLPHNGCRPPRPRRV